MIRILFVAAGSLLASFSFAQAYQGSVEYEKTKQDCMIMEYKYPPEAVENAFKEKMSSLGNKGKEEKGLFNRDKGFRVYKEAVISEISPERHDYIVNIERRSRRDDDEARLYLIILDGDKNALSAFNASETGKVKAFLVNLHPDIEAAHLEIKISDQEDLISKEEKNLKKLENEKDDLEKKLDKQNKEIEDKKAELENLRKLLEELRGKRNVSA